MGANSLVMFKTRQCGWRYGNLHIVFTLWILIKYFNIIASPAVFDCRFLWKLHRMILFRFVLVLWKSALDRLSVCVKEKEKHWLELMEIDVWWRNINKKKIAFYWSTVFLSIVLYFSSTKTKQCSIRECCFKKSAFCFLRLLKIR